MRKNILILLAACLPFVVQAQENSPVLDDITSRLEAYKQHFPLDKLYFQTDKEVYAPGEIIWFSGFVFDRTYNLYSGNCSEITAALYDASGTVIKGDKFTVTNGAFHGDLLLDKEMPLGCYYLAAYTPWQNTPDHVFIKPLVVEAFYKNDAVVSLTDPAKIYQAGSKTTVDLQVTGFDGKPADKFTFNYELRHGDRKLTTGKGRSEAGRVSVPVSIPGETGQDPLVLVVSHPRNQWSKMWALRSSADEIVVRFYVEGNHLSGNVPRKTGFYATTGYGVPLFLEADITDGQGRIISKTRSFRPGFGLFPFKAAPGEICKMTITSDYGKGLSFTLPQVNTAAEPALLVSKADDDFIAVDLPASGTAQRELALTATRGYQLLWAAAVTVSGNSRVRVPVSDLGTGIILLSLFDEKNEVISTRLVYLPEKEQGFPVVGDVTREGDKVRVTVKSVDGNSQPVPVNLILSVTDTVCRIDSRSQGPDLYFPDGELKHAVKGLTDQSAVKSSEWDYLMIANELKDFSWEKVLKQPLDTAAASLLPRGTSGRVTDKKGNPVAHAGVSIFNNREMKMYEAVADEKGTFSIPGLQPVAITDLSATATDRNRKGSFQVYLDPVFAMIVGEKVKNSHFRVQESQQSRNITPVYLSLNPGLTADPPVIRASDNKTEVERPEAYQTMLQSGSGLLDVIRSMKPYTLMGGQIVFYGTINSINAQSGALIVIDGQRLGTQADVLNNISPYDVEKINVSLDPMEIQRYTGLNNVGLIEITTKRGKTVTSELPGTPVKKEDLYSGGYRIPRNFLTTDALREIGGKDLRTTLYWNPALETGSTGTATFSIPLSDIRSGFVITVEQVRPAGEVKRARAFFNVN